MKFLRAALCALVAFGVVAHGAVEVWATAVLEVGALLLLVAWAIHVYRRETEKVEIAPLVLPLLLLAAIVLGQLALHRSLYPYATRVNLQLLIADLILLFLAGQFYRTLADWRGFIWFAMTLGFAVSVFAILQHFTFNGKLYWLREMRFGGNPFGPYVNRNHFAGFVELAIPIGLAPLVLGRVRRERWLLVGLFTFVPVVALVLCASRGGLVSLVVEMVFLGILVALRRSGTQHILAGAVVLLLAVSFVSWLGAERVLERYATLQPLEVTSSKRAAMARDTMHIFLDYPWTGTGLGTLETVFPRYETLYDGKAVDHAHNDYVEALAETGAAGGLACAWFLVTLAWCGLRRILQPRNAAASALQAGAVVACAGFLMHSLVDFNLHIPANALLFLLMANLATVEMSPSPPRARTATP